jgi:hypothetical protein
LPECPPNYPLKIPNSLAIAALLAKVHAKTAQYLRAGGDNSFAPASLCATSAEDIAFVSVCGHWDRVFLVLQVVLQDVLHDESSR